MAISADVLEYHKKTAIHFTISNGGASCSTLLLYNFPYRYGCKNYPIDPVTGVPEDSPFGGGTLDRFLQDLVTAITNWSSGFNVSHPVKYAFVTASVQSEQGLVSQYLEELGFQGTPWVYNLKNKTHVRYFVMPIPEFLEIFKSRGIKFPGEDMVASSYSKKFNTTELQEAA